MTVRTDLTVFAGMSQGRNGQDGPPGDIGQQGNTGAPGERGLPGLPGLEGKRVSWAIINILYDIFVLIQYYLAIILYKYFLASFVLLCVDSYLAFFKNLISHFSAYMQ
jgi:hypothetical protein